MVYSVMVAQMDKTKYFNCEFFWLGNSVKPAEMLLNHLLVTWQNKESSHDESPYNKYFFLIQVKIIISQQFIRKEDDVTHNKC